MANNSGNQSTISSEKPQRSLGGTTYIKNGKRHKIKEGPQKEDLLMVRTTSCLFNRCS